MSHDGAVICTAPGTWPWPPRVDQHSKPVLCSRGRRDLPPPRQPSCNRQRHRRHHTQPGKHPAGTPAQAGGRLCKVGTEGGEEAKLAPGKPSSTEGEDVQTAASGQQTSAEPMPMAVQGGTTAAQGGKQRPARAKAAQAERAVLIQSCRDALSPEAGEREHLARSI